MTAMASSVGAHPDLFHVEVIRSAGTWHRRVKIGAFGFWQPEGCERDHFVEVEIRTTPPAAGVMCEVCWPVWPAEGRR